MSSEPTQTYNQPPQPQRSPQGQQSPQGDDRARLTRLAQALRVRIPGPAKAHRKPQASWRTLKVGQWLTNNTAMFVTHTTYPPGTLWEILEVDSQGVVLAPQGHTLSRHNSHLRWVDPNWKHTFARARKSKRT